MLKKQNCNINVEGSYRFIYSNVTIIILVKPAQREIEKIYPEILPPSSSFYNNNNNVLLLWNLHIKQLRKLLIPRNVMRVITAEAKS